jgi:two-component system, sensor histidine kinase and response regulator
LKSNIKIIEMKNPHPHRIELLKQVSIFANSDHNTIDQIAQHMVYFSYEKEVCIFNKGEMGDAMFIIDSGSVRVHDGDYVFSVLKMDDVFGEYYLIDTEERSASITTVEKTGLYRIDQHTFYTIMSKNMNIIKGILKNSVGRLRTMNEVEEDLASKNAEIEKQKIELAELNATKDKFFSIIAHDLRSPLGTILSFFDLVDSSISALDKTEIIDLIKGIHGSTENMLKLLDNLLQWSGIQTGQMSLNKELFDVSFSINTSIELFGMNAETKGIQLYSEVPEGQLVFGDTNMVTTVIRNLISNALKFTHKGGKVWVSSEENNDFLQIVISDTGIGIKKENIAKLFRIDTRHTTIGTGNEKGTGLGLNLCQSFIEKNNGTIKVKSEFGKGTSMIISLPKKGNDSTIEI